MNLVKCYLLKSYLSWATLFLSDTVSAGREVQPEEEAAQVQEVRQGVTEHVEVQTASPQPRVGTSGSHGQVNY